MVHLFTSLVTIIFSKRFGCSVRTAKALSSLSESENAKYFRPIFYFAKYGCKFSATEEAKQNSSQPGTK
jgi:hypothetical protein